MVPSTWKHVKLKDLLENSIKNGFSPVSTDVETGYWVLGLGALGEDGINVSELKPVAPEKQVLQNILSPNDFLVSRSNTPDKVGRSIVFQGEIANCSYPDLMMKFRINEAKANIYYVAQLLKSRTVRAYFRNCAAGSSSTMVKINKSSLENTPLIIPELPEQTKIVQILSTWDRAIAATEKLLKNSQTQKHALMQQLLTGRKRFSGFGEEWIFIKLSKLIKEIKKTKIENPERIELLTVRLHNRGVVPSGKFPNPTEGGRPYYRRFKGELIIGRQNLHNGGVAIVGEDCDGLIASNAISSFAANENANLEFICALMGTKHFKFCIDSLAGGTGQKEVGVNELLNFKVKVPSVAEQERIANTLNLADKKIKTLESKLDFLKEEKKALMQQLLTGKRQVKVEH